MGRQGQKAVLGFTLAVFLWFAIISKQSFLKLKKKKINEKEIASARKEDLLTIS